MYLGPPDAAAWQPISVSPASTAYASGLVLTALVVFWTARTALRARHDAADRSHRRASRASSRRSLAIVFQARRRPVVDLRTMARRSTPAPGRLVRS